MLMFCLTATANISTGDEMTVAYRNTDIVLHACIDSSSPVNNVGTRYKIKKRKRDAEFLGSLKLRLQIILS